MARAIPEPIKAKTARIPVDSRIAIAMACDRESAVQLDAISVRSAGERVPMEPIRASGPFEIVP